MFVDPLAEETMTPYQYVTNNPIMFTDPTGMEGEGVSPIFGSDGNFRGNTSEGYTGIILIYDGDINDLEGKSSKAITTKFDEQTAFRKMSEKDMLKIGAQTVINISQAILEKLIVRVIILLEQLFMKHYIY